MTTTTFPPASAAMPTATFADILLAMERHPELREAMRQHILDEEIRQLPAIVRELRDLVAELQQTLRDFMAATNARFDRLEAAQAETQADVAELKSDVAELKTGQAELKAGQDAIFATQRSMQAAITRLDGTVNRLDGKSYEHNAAYSAPWLVMLNLRVHHTQVIFASATPHSNHILYDLLTDAVEAGRIARDDAGEIANTDIVLRDGNGGYYVAEASITLDDSDITRARRRADLLAQATGAPAVPFVIGAQILDTSRAIAAAHDVAVCIMQDN